LSRDRSHDLSPAELAAISTQDEDPLRRLAGGVTAIVEPAVRKRLRQLVKNPRAVAARFAAERSAR
jgi:hypothetical protein